MYVHVYRSTCTRAAQSRPKTRWPRLRGHTNTTTWVARRSLFRRNLWLAKACGLGRRGLQGQLAPAGVMAVAGGPWGDCGACPCTHPMGKTFGTKPHSECQRCKANLHNIYGLFEETEAAADFGHVHWCGLACKAASLASRGGGGGGCAAGAPLQPAPTCATGFPPTPKAPVEGVRTAYCNIPLARQQLVLE